VCLAAARRIPVYWLIDVPVEAIEVRTQPGNNGYERCDIYHGEEHVPSPVEGVESLRVSTLLVGLGS
jgi:Uma2 family endonuclease